MNGDYLIYKHTFPNKKVYVGITNQDPERRWRNGSGYKSLAMKAAIQKYGWENIRHEILFIGMTKEEACQKEIELIAFYHSNDPAFGYNRTEGGDGKGRIITEETRMKLRSAHIGKPLSEEHRKKIGYSNKGRKMSEKQKEMVSARTKGKPRSIETKEKISKALSKRTMQIDESGNVIHVFESAIKASKETGIRHIIEACNGKRKTAGGYVWKYVESEV